MFSTDETIHYAGSGVCRIQEIAVKRFGRTREQYYVLQPLHQNTSVIYVPVSNPQLVSKMRPILTRDEVEAMIDGAGRIEPVWNDDVTQRKELFDSLLRSGNFPDLICIIKTLRRQKQRRQEDGKTLHVSDEGYLREAQRLLYDEIAGVYGKTPKEVEAELKDRLKLD